MMLAYVTTRRILSRTFDTPPLQGSRFLVVVLDLELDKRKGQGPASPRVLLGTHLVLNTTCSSS